MAFQRTSISLFSLANNAYINATVAFYTIDSAGDATTTLATLYEDATGSVTMANPHTLDSEGKFASPVYAEVPVIGSVSNSDVDDHATGIIYPRLSDADVTAAESSATEAAASAATAQGAASDALDAQTAAETAQTAAEAAQAAAEAAVGTVKVSTNDTTASTLEDKILVGTGLTLSTQNDGGNETRTISVGDANGDLDLPNGSVSASGADNNLGAGGYRAFSDFSGTHARVGGTAGGAGSAPGVALTNGSGDIIVTDVGSRNKTINEGNRFTGGLEFNHFQFGSVSSTTATIGWSSSEVVLITIGASVVINFSAPDTNYHYAKTVQITQDGTGGRVPTFNRAGATSQIQWTKTEPSWASMAAGEVWRVTAQYLDGWLYLSATKVKT